MPEHCAPKCIDQNQLHRMFHVDPTSPWFLKRHPYTTTTEFHVERSGMEVPRQRSKRRRASSRMTGATGVNDEGRSQAQAFGGWQGAPLAR